MGITTLSMVLTVYVLNLYAVTDRPVPKWADKLVCVYLARLVGMHRKKQPLEVVEEKPSKSQYGATTDLERSVVYSNTASVEEPRRRSQDLGSARMRLNSIELIRVRETMWSKEWKRVAEIVDRLFFWIFLFTIAATTLYLLHPVVQHSTETPAELQSQTIT